MCITIKLVDWTDFPACWSDFQDWLWENHRLKTDWIAGKELKMYEAEYLEDE